MLEREAKREKTLESSAREKRLKAQAQQKKTGGSQAKLQEPVEDTLKIAEEEFFKLVQATD